MGRSSVEVLLVAVAVVDSEGSGWKYRRERQGVGVVLAPGQAVGGEMLVVITTALLLLLLLLLLSFRLLTWNGSAEGCWGQVRARDKGQHRGSSSSSNTSRRE